MTAGEEAGLGEMAQPARDEGRYTSYARVLAALSEDLGPEPDAQAAVDTSYRQHVVIETLRDVESARARFMILQVEDSAGPGAPASRDAAP